MNDEWESSDDDERMLSKDWKRAEKGIEKDGYRQGLEESQEETLQDGFNQAFKQAIKLSLDAGRLQGGICASVSWNRSTEGDNILRDSLENINNDVTSLLSQIPVFMSDKASCADTESCACIQRDGDSSGVTETDSVQNYWRQLHIIQTKAESKDGYLDSSFISTCVEN